MPLDAKSEKRAVASSRNLLGNTIVRIEDTWCYTGLLVPMRGSTGGEGAGGGARGDEVT